LAANDCECLSIVFAPFNPYVLVSVNSRNNDLNTSSTCGESFLLGFFRFLAEVLLKSLGLSVCRLSVCTHVTTLEFLNKFPHFNIFNPKITARTASFKVQNPAFLPQPMYTFCVDLSNHRTFCHIQHSIVGFYSRDGVYCAVRTWSLRRTDYFSCLKGYYWNILFKIYLSSRIIS
jgi:hypothetical protein